jgi:hypothetical protein
VRVAKSLIIVLQWVSVAISWLVELESKQMDFAIDPRAILHGALTCTWPAVVAFLRLINIPYFPIHQVAVRPMGTFRMRTPSTSAG